MPIELQTNIALIPEPASPAHLVNVRWVENFFQGLQKAPVRLVATVEQTGTFDLGDKDFTYTAVTPTTIDGEVVAVGDRILFTGQLTDPEENLIYECSQAGDGTDPTILKIAPDFDEDHKIQPGISVTVTEGDDHANQTWRLTTLGTIILGSTALTWEPYIPPKTTEVFTDDIDTANGTATASGGMEWEIEHDLGTDAVTVQIYNNANNSLVMADVVTARADNSASTNILTVRFAVEPAPGASYRVVVVG